MANSRRFTNRSDASRAADALRHDPDFDPLEPRSDRVQAEVDLRPYQRLIANPFLALATLTVMMILIRAALRQRALDAFLIALGFGLPGPWLLHYHCLDCGKTGVLWRWRRHACSRVVARIQARRPLRFRGPTPTTQVVLWFYLLVFVALARLVFH